MENKSDFLKQRGSVKVSHDLLMQNPVGVQQVLSHILIIRAENDFMTDAITYYGYSELFEPVEDLEEPPQYNFVVTCGQNGKPYDVKAERVR